VWTCRLRLGGCLIAKFLYVMQDRQATTGLVTVCIGGGQGMTIIFER